jgi:hypothetical protein
MCGLLYSGEISFLKQIFSQQPNRKMRRRVRPPSNLTQDSCCGVSSWMYFLTCVHRVCVHVPHSQRAVASSHSFVKRSHFGMLSQCKFYLVFRLLMFAGIFPTLYMVAHQTQHAARMYVRHLIRRCTGCGTSADIISAVQQHRIL